MLTVSNMKIVNLYFLYNGIALCFFTLVLMTTCSYLSVTSRIPYDDLEKLGIPPPPEGQYMSRYQVLLC